MSFKKILAVAALVQVAIATTPQAATLSATALFDDVTNFTVDFNDSNSNLLLDFSEVTSFSGVTLGITPWPDLFGTPNIAGFSVAGGLFAQCNNFPNLWCFGNFGDSVGTWSETSPWSYQITGLNPVPLPAALPLFAAGLSAMGFMGWRRKRKAA